MNWQKLSAENRRFLFLFALFILVFYSMITYSSASTMYKSMNDSRVRHAGKMATSAVDKEKGATANAKGEVIGRFMRGMAVEPKRTAGTCDTASVSLYGIGLVK